MKKSVYSRRIKIIVVATTTIIVSFVALLELPCRHDVLNTDGNHRQRSSFVVVEVNAFDSSYMNFNYHAHRNRYRHHSILSNPSTLYRRTDHHHCGMQAFHNRYDPVIPAQNRNRSKTTARTSTSLSVAATAVAKPAITTIVTGIALSISSLGGMACQHRWPSTGILGSLLTAGFISTIAKLLSTTVSQLWTSSSTVKSVLSILSIPTSHPLYDLCFQLFLPASLTLLLLAYQPPSSSVPVSSSKPSTTNVGNFSSSESSSSISIRSPTSTAQNPIVTCIQRTLLPFVVASVASWIGCCIAYKISVRFNWFFGSGGSSVGSRWSLPTNAVLNRDATTTIINEEYARNAASILTASYVGGSVNAMATSRILSTPKDLVGSLVAADLLTMSFYFSFLEASLDWDDGREDNRTRRWWHIFNPRRFLEGKKRMTTEQSTIAGLENGMFLDTDGADGAELVTSNEEEIERALPNNDLKSTDRTPQEKRNLLLPRLIVSVPLLVGTYALVSTANIVERIVSNKIGIPGTSCAVLAVVAPLLNTWFRNLSTEMATTTATRGKGNDLFQTMAEVANPLSDFFFLLFFASLGLSVDLSTAFMSFGPACLAFSTVALSIHVIGTLIGCWPLARLASSRVLNKSKIGLEEAWIASNAAIGGPATAAAFVMNCMKGKSARDDKLLQGRTIAATVWGVVGYAIGTILGIQAYKWMM